MIGAGLIGRRHIGGIAAEDVAVLAGVFGGKDWLDFGHRHSLRVNRTGPGL